MYAIIILHMYDLPQHKVGVACKITVFSNHTFHASQYRPRNWRLYTNNCTYNEEYWCSNPKKQGNKYSNVQQDGGNVIQQHKIQLCNLIFVTAIPLHFYPSVHAQEGYSTWCVCVCVCVCLGGLEGGERGVQMHVEV